MASERAHPDRNSPETLRHVVDINRMMHFATVSFPIMLRSAIEGMTEEQIRQLHSDLSLSHAPESDRAALLRAVGVEP